MLAVRSGYPKVAEIRSRIEPDLKENATRVLASCGQNLSDAIRLFLRQVVAQNGLPFEVTAPNAVKRAAMEEANSGKLPPCGGSPFAHKIAVACLY